MRLLWENGPMYVRTMLDHYSEPRPHFNTVSTTVRILEEKGYVGHEVISGSHLYYALVKPEEFRERSLTQLVKNFFGNSYASVVSSLAEQEKVSVDELRHIIEIMELRNKSEEE